LNPYLRKLIEVTTKPNFEAGNVELICGLEPCSCNLTTGTDSFVCFNFKQISVCPSCYTIRHTSARDNECLRNWKLQGSFDYLSWTDLDVRVNDVTLNTKGQIATFTLTNPSTSYFQYLRVMQTGMNSSSNLYMSLAGFEVYGY
jgi:hypothetical protein